MLGESVIVNIKLALTQGSLKSSRKIPQRLTERGGTGPGDSGNWIWMMMRISCWMLRLSNRRQTTMTTQFRSRKLVLNLKKRRRRTERKTITQQDTGLRMKLAHVMRTPTTKRRKRVHHAGQKHAQSRAVQRDARCLTATLLCQSDAKRSVIFLF
jgi:hypothetical protein